MMNGAALHPDKAEWRRFYDSVRACGGLDLTEYKQDQLRKRVLALMESEHFGSLEELGERVARDRQGFRWFTHKLAINVSEFYRDPHKWQELRARVLQGLAQGRPGLKCWSAGCSFGAEAHTLAIVLDVHFPGPHSILCTDIDQTALDRAQAGEFSDQEMRRVPPEVRGAYFDWNPILGCWKARPSLANYFRYGDLDLLSEEFEDGFDLILCRNVFIYLSEEAKEALYGKFHGALRPGGVLFTGGAEKIPNPWDFAFESTLPCFYQKPLVTTALAAA